MAPRPPAIRPTTPARLMASPTRSDSPWRTAGSVKTSRISSSPDCNGVRSTLASPEAISIFRPRALASISWKNWFTLTRLSISSCGGAIPKSFDNWINCFNFSLLFSNNGSIFDKSLPRLSRILVLPAWLGIFCNASLIAISCLSGDCSESFLAERPRVSSAWAASPDLFKTASPTLSLMSLKISAMLSPVKPACSAAYCHDNKSCVDIFKDLAQRSASVTCWAVFLTMDNPAAPIPTAAVAAAAPTAMIAELTSLASFFTWSLHFWEALSALPMPWTNPPTLAIRSIVNVPSDLPAIAFSPGNKKPRRSEVHH